MAGGGIRAGKAFIEVFLDGSNVRKGLQGISRGFRTAGAAMAKSGAALTAAGTAVLAPLTAATLSFAKYGDTLGKMSKRTGVSAQSLARLGFAAEQSGSSLQDVETGLRGMARFMFNASRGSKEYTDVLDMLGLTMADIDGKTPEEQFQTFAEALRNVEGDTMQAGLAMRVFGRSATSLLPLIDSGEAGLKQLGQQAEDVGRVLTDEDVAAAERLTDAINLLKSSFTGIIAQVGGSLAPTLSSLAEWLSGIGAMVGDFIGKNRVLVQVIAGAAVGVTALGVALIALSGPVTAIGVAMPLIGTALAAIAPFVAPVLAIGAAFAGIATVVFSVSGGVSTLRDGLGSLSAIATDTFGGIMAALKSGDFESAGQIAMQGLEAAWKSGKATLLTIWEDFKFGMIEAFSGAVISIQKMWTGLQGTIAKSLLELAGKVQELQDPSGGVTAGMFTAWSKATGLSWLADAATGGTDMSNAADRAAAGGLIDEQTKARQDEFAQTQMDILNTAREMRDEAANRARAEADAARSSLDNATQQARMGAALDELNQFWGNLRGVGDSMWGTLTTMGSNIADEFSKWGEESAAGPMALSAVGGFDVRGIQSALGPTLVTETKKQTGILEGIEENTEEGAVFGP